MFKTFLAQILTCTTVPLNLSKYVVSSSRIKYMYTYEYYVYADLYVCVKKHTATHIDTYFASVLDL